MNTVMVISFILYIEDSVLRFVSHGFRFILEEWRPTTVRQRLEDPPSLSEFHLSISELFLQRQSIKYTDIKACYRQFNWAMLAGFFVSTWGGGETNVAPHSPGQNQVYSPWNCPHSRGIQTKVTIITRHNKH